MPQDRSGSQEQHEATQDHTSTRRHGVEQGPALTRAGSGTGALLGGRLAILLAAVVTAVLAFLAVRALDPQEVWDALADADLVWLIPSLAALAVAFAIRALRWQLLFEPPDRPPLREAARALLAGLFLNCVLPLRAGEIGRLVLLHRRTGAPRLAVLGTIAAERIYDVLALLALLAVALPWLPNEPWLNGLAAVGGGVAVAVLALGGALARWGERLARIVVWPLRWVGFSEERRERAGGSLLTGVGALHRLRLAGAAAALTLLSWLVFWLSYWLLLQGFDLEVGPAAALLVLVATGFGMAVPSGPSAVGVFEAAVIVALHPFGVPAEQALSYALVLHAVNVVPYLPGGLLLLSRSRG